MNNKKIIVKKKLSRASASSRIISRFLDYLLNLGFWISIFFVFLTNGFGVYTFSIAILINVIFSNFYFTFCLYVFGQTFFMFVFKIKLFDNKLVKKKYFLKILRHEFFLSIIFHILFLLLSIIFLIIGEEKTLQFFQFLLNINFNSQENSAELAKIGIEIQIFAYFYSTFLFFLFFLLFIICVGTIIKSNKKTIIDSISFTNTLSLIEVKEKKKTQIKKINVDMPGVFDENEIMKGN